MRSVTKHDIHTLGMIRANGFATSSMLAAWVYRSQTEQDIEKARYRLRKLYELGMVRRLPPEGQNTGHRYEAIG